MKCNINNHTHWGCLISKHRPLSLTVCVQADSITAYLSPSVLCPVALRDLANKHSSLQLIKRQILQLFCVEYNPGTDCVGHKWELHSDLNTIYHHLAHPVRSKLDSGNTDLEGKNKKTSALNCSQPVFRLAEPWVTLHKLDSGKKSS